MLFEFGAAKRTIAQKHGSPDRRRHACVRPTETTREAQRDGEAHPEFTTVDVKHGASQQSRAPFVWDSASVSSARVYVASACSYRLLRAPRTWAANS